jgi:hypothetical protein
MRFVKLFRHIVVSGWKLTRIIIIVWELNIGKKAYFEIGKITYKQDFVLVLATVPQKWFWGFDLPDKN